jgi:uncharacterized protein (TIRG00374 family)
MGRDVTEPPVEPLDAAAEDDHDDELGVSFSRRQLLIFVLFIVSAIAFFYFVLPQVTGLQDTWHRINHGDPLWLIVAAVLELSSFVGYIGLLRAICGHGDQSHQEIDWKVSYEITMAGVAATRLFSAAGAGGIALTAWALRRAGMAARTIAVRLVAMNVLLYGFYMATVIVVGFLLWTGLLHGGSSFALTLLPALIALVLLGIIGSMALLPTDADRLFARWAAGTGRMQKVGKLLVTVPAAASSGVREAIAIVRERPSALWSTAARWGFDIATLWACFHAFGSETPPIGVIILAYFLGTMGNLLPLPGGVGGVEGGMIGAFAAFDVNFGLATVAVLSYRAFSFWLPTIPGAIAYVQLRGTVKKWRAAEPEAPESAAAAAA